MHQAFALSKDHLDNGDCMPIGRRSAPRLRLSLPARLVTISDTRRCILIDLSRSGAQIGLERPLKSGADVFLQIADIDQFGIVRRQAHGLMGGLNGIEFDDRLTDKHVISMRHYADTFQEEANRALRREASNWVSGIS